MVFQEYISLLLNGPRAVSGKRKTQMIISNFTDVEWGNDIWIAEKSELIEKSIKDSFYKEHKIWHHFKLCYDVRIVYLVHNYWIRESISGKVRASLCVLVMFSYWMANPGPVIKKDHDESFMHMEMAEWMSGSMKLFVEFILIEQNISHISFFPIILFLHKGKP